MLISLLSGSYLTYVHDWLKRPVRSDWPAAALAQQADQTWNQISTCPLDTVACNAWAAGLIAINTPSQPSVLLFGDPRFTPWVTAERVQRHGALWAWRPEDAEDGEPAPVAVLQDLGSRPDMRMQAGTWSIPWPRAQKQQPLVVQWRAYVPAACERR